MIKKFPKGNGKGRTRITHTEILRAEKFGSRDKAVIVHRCAVCGGENKGEGVISAIGEFFCSMDCRVKNFSDIGGFGNDKKGAYTALLFEQGDN